MTTKKKPKAPGNRRQPPLTTRQKKLVAILPEVAEGKITKKAALLKAGYSESTAEQQGRTFGGVRNNARMQEALRAAGFTEELIAEQIMVGVTKLRAGRPHLAYVQTGAELLDAFPAKKIDATITEPMTYADLDAGPKAKTPEEARVMADRTNNG